MIEKMPLKNIPLLLSLLLLLVNVCFVYIWGYYLNKPFSIYFISAFCLSSFLVSFIVLYFFISHNLNRNIKLIYNTITDLNKNIEPSSKKKLDKSLKDINVEVTQYTNQKEKELTSLRSLETYRKQFVGNISHELKTPIFTIQGYIHSLIEGGVHDEQVRDKFLNKAAKNASRLQTIVEDLELINKLESKQLLSTIIRFDLNILVSEVDNELEIMAKESNVKITINNTYNGSCIALADKEAIRQVFTNLLVNAIKYGKDGGFINIGIYSIPGKWMIKLIDNGIGIKEEHLIHLFDRFYRVDPSRSRKQGGSGLGLSIVKHIIDSHNQMIDVKSTFGKGTEFTFTLEKG